MAAQATKFSWTDLLRGMADWLRHNLPRALLMSALSFAFGWIVNFWVMAFRWDGFRAPSGESDYIAAQNSLLSGSLFWAALSSFLFAVLAYGYRAGWSQLREEVFSLPSRISAMFKGDERNRSLTTLAWAVALSLLLAIVISPGVAAVTAGFFLFFAATPLGDLLAGVIRRLWMQVVARFAPHKGEPTSEVGAAAVTAAGMLAGFVIAATVDILLLKVLAVVLAGLAAYYFANEDELGASGGTAVFLLIAAAVGLYELFEAGMGVALADDGGWSECGDCNIIDYVTSTGATEVVSRSTVAGAGAGVGAPIGASVGDVLGSIGGGGGDVGGGGSGGGTGPGPDGGGTGDSTGDGSPDTGTPRTAVPDDAATDDAAAADADEVDILGAVGGGAGSLDGDGGTGDDAGSPDKSGTETAVPTRRPRPGDGVGAGTTTVILTGDAARDALAGQVGDEIDLPDDEQWDLDASSGDETVRSGNRGTRGTITGFGPVAEGEDGELVVSVDVETGGTTTPPAPPADPTTSGDEAAPDPSTMPPPAAVPPVPDAPPPTGGPTTDAPTPDAPATPPEPDAGTAPPTEATPPEPPARPADPPPVPPRPDEPPPQPPTDETAAAPEAEPAPEEAPPPKPDKGGATPSTNVWGRDQSGWLNDAATKLGEAKDTLEGWIDDLWGGEEASGIKDKLQTERIGENLQQVVDATDTYNHFHDMAGETMDELDRLGVDENGQNAVTWMRVTVEGAGRATQEFVDRIVTPVISPVVEPFGGDADEIAHTLLPVQETAEEASQAALNAARYVRGGDNYGGQARTMEQYGGDWDLSYLRRFP